MFKKTLSSIALAAALGAGLHGIEHELQPGEAVTGNAYEQDHPPQLALPATLDQAAAALVTDLKQR